MMTKITGAGCSLGGVTATYLAVAEPLVAALAASLLYDRASEIAEVKSDGPGSFQVALLDALRNGHRRPGGRVRHHRNQLTATFRGWFRTIAIVYTEYIRSVRCDGKINGK